MKYRNLILTVAISFAVANLTVLMYSTFNKDHYQHLQQSQTLPVHNVDFKNNGNNPTTDFTYAASASIAAVVHIQTHIKEKEVKNNTRQKSPFSDFFGDDDSLADQFNDPLIIPEQRGSGSGVLLSKDGYIVTNNHVIKNADEIIVTLANHKTFKASVVGTDAGSDLAVIKIHSNNLSFLAYGNSDEIQTGQWVLAIGYPLNLDVTVTAGIISAKVRFSAITKDEKSVQSFIQTDAAVNFGSSGGALVNTNGELIGLNTAFVSSTGSYAGYSYAIPVNVIKKIVTHLIKYGNTQKITAVVFPNDK
jgi:serine protease Do